MLVKLEVFETLHPDSIKPPGTELVLDSNFSNQQLVLPTAGSDLEVDSNFSNYQLVHLCKTI